MGKSSSFAKTPTVLQMEAVECGAAALGSVLAYYGLWLSLERLRHECGVNRDGSKASNIVKAARRFRMQAAGYRIPAEKIRHERFPVIIHWNFNHFLVLEGFKGDTVFLNDPAVGHRSVPWQEFIDSYTGILLRIEPDAGFERAGAPYSVVRAIAGRLLGEQAALAFVLLIGFCLILPGLAAPVFDQIFLDEIITGKQRGWLFNLLLAMGLAAGLQGSLIWLRAWCLTRWQQKLTLGGAGTFFWHVLHLPIEFFQQRFGGEVASRVQFNEQIARIMTGKAATALLDMAVAVFYLALLLQYSVVLTLVGVCFSLATLVLLVVVRRRVLELSLRMQQDIGKAQGTAMNGIQIIETLKANGNESDFFAKWAGYQAKVLDGRQKIDQISQIMSNAPVLFNAMNVALIMTLGGFQIMDGLLSAGAFMAFQTLIGRFQQPLHNLADLGQALQTTEMQMQRLDDVYSYQRDNYFYARTEENQQPGQEEPEYLSGLTEIRGVTFGYSPLAAPLLEGLSLTIKPGRWVALVGGSGSGKSTVTRLLTGLYKPWQGEILFDGEARTKLPIDLITSSVAVVDQDIYLFSGTIRDNIALFDLHVPQRDIIQAARDAVIHEDILALEQGYATLVNEGGSNFSGGQRQRLELARALALNPALLVLDEATSALDPLTEREVLDNIRRRGCACLMVAHRLSAIRDCDEIIVLANGKIAQRGTHDEMIAVDGPYRTLVGSMGGG